jgi:hypothetical protein
MKLGESFPPEERRAYIQRSLKPGAILHIFCPFTLPPKFKYCVLVCVEPEPVLFLVNSKKSQWIEDRPALRDCQVVLQQRDHPFLRHDSHIDCTQARRDLPLEEIERQLMEDLDNLKGEITTAEREAIVYAVRGGTTIETRVKRAILTALGGS